MFLLDCMRLFLSDIFVCIWSERERERDKQMCSQIYTYQKLYLPEHNTCPATRMYARSQRRCDTEEFLIAGVFDIGVQIITNSILWAPAP